MPEEEELRQAKAQTEILRLQLEAAKADAQAQTTAAEQRTRHVEADLARERARADRLTDLHKAVREEMATLEQALDARRTETETFADLLDVRSAQTASLTARQAYDLARAKISQARERVRADVEAHTAQTYRHAISSVQIDNAILRVSPPSLSLLTSIGDAHDDGQKQLGASTKLGQALASDLAAAQGQAKILSQSQTELAVQEKEQEQHERNKLEKAQEKLKGTVAELDRRLMALGTDHSTLQASYDRMRSERDRLKEDVRAWERTERLAQTRPEAGTTSEQADELKEARKEWKESTKVLRGNVKALKMRLDEVRDAMGVDSWDDLPGGSGFVPPKSSTAPLSVPAPLPSVAVGRTKASHKEVEREEEEEEEEDVPRPKKRGRPPTVGHKPVHTKKARDIEVEIESVDRYSKYNLPKAAVAKQPSKPAYRPGPPPRRLNAPTAPPGLFTFGASAGTGDFHGLPTLLSPIKNSA